MITLYGDPVIKTDSGPRKWKGKSPSLSKQHVKYVTPKNVNMSEAHISNNSCGKKKEQDDGCKLVQGNEILLPVLLISS